MSENIRYIGRVSDAQVPEFGSSFGVLRPIDPRDPEALAQYRPEETPLLRALHYSYGVGPTPYLRFPDAENIQHYPFPEWAWQRYGIMETEKNRIAFVLQNYPEKGMPSGFRAALEILDTENPLNKWQDAEYEIRKAAYEEFIAMKAGMENEADQIYNNGYQAAFVADPQFYEVDEETLELEMRVWQNALAQITGELANGNTQNLRSFLKLHARVKSPINPIFLGTQEAIFLDRYNNASEKLVGVERNQTQDEILVAQLAKESAFLAFPEAREAEIVFAEHQELPLIRVDLAKLPRGEFAGAERVVKIMMEDLENAAGNRAEIVPIAVAHTIIPEDPDSDIKNDPFLFIVDGNNRASALIVFEYFKTFGFELSKNQVGNVNKFMNLVGLDLEWEVDLVKVLAYLAKHPENLETLQTKQEIVSKFNINSVPALLTSEPDHNVVAVEKSIEEGKVVIMGPHNQALFNSSVVSIKAKKQSHGRAEGNHERRKI